MAYCAIADVRAALVARREPYDSSVYSDDSVELAITHAEAIVDAYTGRHFKAEEVSERRVATHSARYGWHIVTGHPVLSVSSVVNVYGVDVGYQIVNSRVVQVDTSGEVMITYLYNDPVNPVPVEIAYATAAIAANILANPPTWLEAVSVPVSMSLRVNAATYLPPDIRIILAKHSHLP